ncbi:MAG: CDP-glycerol glycerophosphotransferase family protein [Gammaproteobacteria bacterium]|nr:CDP-glycerol glycerophosphotransferase family protein [Gammaproteobacteria bacterium]
MKVVFDVQRLYYLPQYEPLMRELKSRGVECIAIARDDGDPEGRICRNTLGGQFAVETAGDVTEAIALARAIRPDWTIVGNDNPYRGETTGRSALLYHGIGVKQVYYSPHLMDVDLRFVEGPYREAALQERFPDAWLEPVGFPKLDPLLKGEVDTPDIGLDATKPTVLYAPTFFPSSIGKLPLDFPARLDDCNLIIKPHQFSLTNRNYADQRRRFAAWEKYSNVFVAGPEWPSLVPFMAMADMLVSEASSALFEFAALDKPVVWCDFLKLRWGYRWPFGYRLRRRMDQEIHRYADVAAHARSPRDLYTTVREELENPERRASERARITAELIGPTDGRASRRAADILLEK